MNIFTKLSAGLLLAGLAAAPAAAVQVVDIVEAPTGFFAPGGSATTASPYYRDQTQDWGWTHGAITDPFTTAELSISAYDVDFAQGEIDEIYAYDDGVLTLLGTLNGADSVYAFTTFTLGANFFNDIAAGLQIFMDIDTANAGWLVTLGKSVLTTDGADLPNPNPGTVPVPAALPMVLSGLAALGFISRRRNKA